jgi:hypothetical protein
MPGLVPGIHVFRASQIKAWMAGTSPAMTNCNERFPISPNMLEPKRSPRVKTTFVLLSLSCFPSRIPARHKETSMTLTDPHIGPVVALIAGVLILIVPRLLSFIVAVYLIIIGLNGLNGIHHFIR